MPSGAYFDAMRTTVTVDDKLWGEALRVTGAVTNKALIERGLRALIDQAARQRAISLAGSMPDIRAVARRKFSQGGSEAEAS